MVNDQWGDWSEEQPFDVEAVDTDPPAIRSHWLK